MLDAERIIEDADIIEISSRLGIVMSDDLRHVSSDGNRLQILCPYHNDHNFGSAHLVVKNGKKGMKCYACGTYKSLVQLVADKLNYELPNDYAKVLTFIAENNGGVDKYKLTPFPKYKRNKSTAKDNIPDALNMTELTLLSLDGRKYTEKENNISGTVVASFDYRVDKSMLKRNEKCISHITSNQEYNPNDNESYPVLNEWLIVKKDLYSINSLYADDFETYRWLILQRAEEKLNEIEAQLNNFLKRRDKLSVNRSYDLKKNKEIVQSIISKFSVTQKQTAV